MTGTGDEGVSGRWIGPYRLLEQIGGGAQGTVWLAEQREPVRRRVAVKVFNDELRSPDARARFRAEEQALARMDHRGIAKVLDAGTTEEGLPYFAMEFVPGQPITAYCDARRLTVAQRVELFRQVCDAVQHAHQKGVIHRDLKPANVLVQEENDRPVAKVVDFGLARAVDRQLVSDVVHTEIGAILGTYEYMSPEQASGSPIDIDTRTDIYSLGVILYELLVGALPFSSQELRQAGLLEIQRVLREELPPSPSAKLRALGPDADLRAERRHTTTRALQRQVDRDLEWVTMRCLEKERARRYATANGLAEDLQRYLDGQPVQAGPPSAFYRLRKWVRRHRVGVAAAAAVFVSLVAGLWVSMTLLAQLQEVTAGYRRIQDLTVAESLLEEGERIRGVTPEHVEPMEDWLVRARALVARLPDHRRVAEELGPPAGPDDPDRKLREDLQLLVSELERLAPMVGVIEAEVRLANELEQRSVRDAADAWAEARAAIAASDGERASRDYEGLDLPVQSGLVPIGFDPVTRLWEFAHLRTGVPPERDENRELIITPDTGLVLVLIPGGEFIMGAQSTDEGESNYDADAIPRESPPHGVEVAAFFLSKYEMTQAQWKGLTGEEPSFFSPAIYQTMVRGQTEEVAVTRESMEYLPVEKISFQQAADELARTGLRLPTEDEWEYAARATTTTRWPWGDDLADICQHANIADLSITRAGSFTDYLSDQSDGYPGPAPVNAFEPNLFGLYCVVGNCWEWVAGEMSPYAPGAHNDQYEGRRVVRGGSWRYVPHYARISYRWSRPEGGPANDTGVRPARSILSAGQ